MKKIIFSALSLILLLQLTLVNAECLNSADDYAVEVVLNKPDAISNLALLNSAKNVVVDNGKYILKSINPNMGVVIESLGRDVSVRVQVPMKSESKSIPKLEFVTSRKGDLNISEDFYNGWRITCGSEVDCEFKKGKTSILASLSGTRYEIDIEINENLASCQGCDGACIASVNSRCVNKQLRDDIENILKHSGLIDSFSELLVSYRVISSGEVIMNDLTPEASDNINWNDAMRNELLYLRNLNLIFISSEDIEEISKLANQGSAGQNSRIVYDSDAGKWNYYYKTMFPSITKLVNCQELRTSTIPAEEVSFSSGGIVSGYFFVPIMITLLLFTLIGILVIIARIVEKTKKA